MVVAAKSAQVPNAEAVRYRRLSEYKGQPFPEDTEFVVEMIVAEQARSRSSDETRKVDLNLLTQARLHVPCQSNVKRGLPPSCK